MALNETEVNLIFFLRSEGYLLSDYLPPKKIKFDLRTDYLPTEKRSDNRLSSS